MTDYCRYTDTRRAGVENNLNIRLAAMQRFEEQAEQRFQRSTERHKTDMALTRQQIHEEFRGARKHLVNTAWATVGGVFVGMILIMYLAGCYLK